MLTLASGQSSFTFSLLAILASAGLVAIVANRLRVATVPAYLITGMLIGPGGAGVIRGTEDIEALGGLAIVLLMFGIGLHMDTRALKGRLVTMVVAGFGSVLTTVAILWPISLMLAPNAPSALVIAMALSLSSTAVVVRILQDRRELSRSKGRLALGILVAQDLAVFVMLLLLPMIARWAGVVHADGAGTHAESSLAQDLLSLGWRAAALAALVLVGKLVLPKLLDEASRMKSGEVMIVVATAFAIGSAAVTSVIGLSAELGAFLAGFLLSGTTFRHHLSGQIGTLRDLFIAVFFTAFGLSIDPAVIAKYLPTVLAGSAFLLLAKAIAIGLTCWCTGASVRVAIFVGLALCQAGEFALVIFQAAGPGQMELLDEVVVSKLTAIVALSLLFTPAVISLASKLSHSMHITSTAPWFRGAAELQGSEDESATPKRKAIVAGYGLVGRTVADRLRKAGLEITIIEMNPQTVRTQAGLGRSIVYGDVSNPEVLEEAGIEEAEALVLTIPDDDSVLRACSSARKLNPKLLIVARSNFVSRGMQMRTMGADVVVVEEIATASIMDQEVLRHFEEQRRLQDETKSGR